MNPPKPKATEEDALGVLYEFLSAKVPPECPPHFDRKVLTQKLRDNGFVVTRELSGRLEELCHARKNTEEYHHSWLSFMGFEKRKSTKQEFDDFYEGVILRAKERKLLNSK